MHASSTVPQGATLTTQSPRVVVLRSRRKAAGLGCGTPKRSKCNSITCSASASGEYKAPEEVLIIGGGVVGASIAYHLTKRGITPTVVEATEVAAAASGKAGGFLAGGWGDGGPTQALHRVSFGLHEKLAAELNIESYRKLPTLSVSGGRRSRVSSPPASWLDGDVARAALMDSDTAQVTPLELTTKLMDAAVAAGAKLTMGEVTGAVLESANGEEKLTGVTLANGETLSADATVFAMGPWTTRAGDWLGVDVPMEGVKSVSLVYKDRQPVRDEPFALFCAEDMNGCHLEVYPRPNGDVYICGCGGSDYVSGPRLRPGGDMEDASKVMPDMSRVSAASASFAGLTSLGEGGPDAVGSCMRPCPPDAKPIMGGVPGISGAYLCAGHNCWGILWAPVSGLAMSELLVDGTSHTVDLAAFSPARFMSRTSGRGKNMGGLQVGEQW